MALEKEKIQENFEEFMFYIDDTLDAIKQKASKQGYHLDMSLESLKDLAQFVRENDVKNDPENILVRFFAYKPKEPTGLLVLKFQKT